METTITQYQTTSPECMGVFLTNPNGSTKTVALEYVNLDPAQQLVYDDFVGILADNESMIISNTPSGMDVTHPVAGALNPTPVTLDYDTMSAGDKSKIDAFINLLNSL